MSSQQTRQTLIEKIRDQHDDQSWEDFVFYYRAYIYKVIQSWSFRHEDCEDLTQEVLLKAWKALPKFIYDSSSCRFRTWLVQVTRNTVRDYLKSKTFKKKNLERLGIEDFDGVIQAEIEKRAELEWKKYVAELAWASIQEDFSESVLEAFLTQSDGVSVADVAEKLGVAENSVYVYRKRVQKALMKEIIRLDHELG